MFNPGLQIGEIINNARLCEIFKCGIQGGMRKSNTTNTLVIVTDYTRGVYHDKWIGGVLHYTGMGLKGDQDVDYMQNAILHYSGTNGVDVHLFAVMDPGEYTYCGRIELVSKPYTEMQPDIDGNDRIVWIFPVRPVPDNNVKKPTTFVFKDMDDYKANGKKAEETWAKTHSSARKSVDKSSVDIKGKKIKHKTYGVGTITKFDGERITVKFLRDIKTLEYKFCIDKELIEFI